MTLFLDFLRGCRCIVFAAILLTSTAALSQTFFQNIDDLPVAPGLTEVVDDGMRFDSPAGRIVTAVASGAGDVDAFRQFYANALPALGWKAADGSGYRRDGEALMLEFSQRGGRVELRVRLVPEGSENSR